MPWKSPRRLHAGGFVSREGDPFRRRRLRSARMPWRAHGRAAVLRRDRSSAPRRGPLGAHATGCCCGEARFDAGLLRRRPGARGGLRALECSPPGLALGPDGFAALRPPRHSLWAAGCAFTSGTSANDALVLEEIRSTPGYCACRSTSTSTKMASYGSRHIPG